VGQAFLYQQQDVMDSVQRLRAQAQALGNLQSTPQENVVTDAGTIEILPANPQVIYVPVYQPDVVFSRRAYGAPFISFGLGFALGAWLDHDFDWHEHHLIVWPHDRPRPADWWSHRPSERPRVEVSHATVWQPRNRPGPPARELDRGRDVRQVRGPTPPIVSQPRPVERREAAAQRPAEAPRARPANGALIGVQSSHDTRQFSGRGQESRQTIARPAAPPARPAAPPAHSAAPARSESPSRQPTTGKR
jgi:hypothetical protein